MTTKEFNRCLQWIATGNNRGMEEIYRCYIEKLKFSAGLEGCDKATAEDIASNVVLSIFNNAANYGYIEAPDAYMYKALKFAVINYKKKNSRVVYTDSIDEVYSAKDDKIDLKLDLKHTLEKLPERQRKIIELHYVFGLKIKQIAKVTGISVSTVNRDLKDLKDELKKFKDYFKNR